MDTLLKRNKLWQYTKVTIVDPTYANVMFIVEGEKDEDIGFITTYISRGIHFHTRGIDFPQAVWKNIKSLFNKVNESEVMEIEKDLISLDPHSFERIKDYLSCIKEL